MATNWIDPPLKFLTFLFLTIIAAPTAIFFIVYRAFVRIIVKLFYPEISGILPAQHAILALSPRVNFPLNIILIIVLDGAMSEDKCQKDFQDRVLSLTRKPNGDKIYEKLKYYYIHLLGYPFWRKEDNFRIQDHIRKYDYQGTLALSKDPSKQELEMAAGKLLKRAWAPNQSPWEALLVGNFRGLSQTAVVFRINHALCDGLSLMKIMELLCRTEWSIPSIKMSKPSGILSTALKVPWDLCRIPFADAKIQRMGLGKGGGENRVLFGEGVPVDLIKSIKSHFGVCYAAVLYSALSGAIERVLKESNLEVPERISCLVTTPLPKHPGGLTNHVMVPVIELPLRVKVQEARLKIIHENMVKASKSLLPLLTKIFCQLGAGIYPTALVEAVGLSHLVLDQVFSTIVPTTMGQIHYDGVEALDMIPVLSCPLRLGIGAVFGGINNKQTVCISFDTACFPSLKAVEKISEYFNNEIETLMRSAKV